MSHVAVVNTQLGNVYINITFAYYEFVCQNNMEKTFRPINWPTIRKLQQFNFNAFGSSTKAILVRTLMGSLEYGRIFPALKSVRLLGGHGPQDDDPEEENREEYRTPRARAFSCEKVSKLEVSLCLGAISFS